MLTLMILASIILAVIVNVISSFYVCFNVTETSETASAAITMVSGVVLLNAIFPFFLGCMTALWFMA